MKRQATDDGNWFDLSAAERFKEATFHDGHNFVSRETNSQWDHEELYRTLSGRWVLHTWKQRQGCRDTWTVADDVAAARWLARNEHEAHPACTAEFAGLEI